MARRYKSEKDVLDVMNKLARAFPTYGSVAKLTHALNEKGSEASPIHQNRLHTLLNGDERTGVNERAFFEIKNALKRLVIDDSKADNLREKILPLVPEKTSNWRDRLNDISEYMAIPHYVCEYFAKSIEEKTSHIEFRNEEADWSWQDIAVEETFAAICSKQKSRIGLIIPTGGGKTRIANRIALKWLATDETNKVTWITHRVLLEEQAEQSFLSIMKENFEKTKWKHFRKRMHFRQISQISENGLAQDTNLFIIDEAHHAAAPSYASIVENSSSNGLFLTATPNRMDKLPLGIESIAYETTYRELIDKHCLVEPVFEDPYEVNGISLFREEETLNDFANYVLQRKEEDLKKVLICVTRKDYAEKLYSAIVSCWDRLDQPVLRTEDIGFVHADANSNSENGRATSTIAFLNLFKSKEEGILISTAPLIGEGFDDPSIDSVFVTYPSESISHLMQVAGRALRRCEGKESAKIIQIRTAKLEYYFNQKWLYQDISDTLRPVLEDITFVDKADLIEKIELLFGKYQIIAQDKENILKQISLSENFQTARIFMSGLPYYGQIEKFQDNAKWRGTFLQGSENHKFIRFFNDISFRDEIRNHDEFLAKHQLTCDAMDGFFKDLVSSTNGAKAELQGRSERQRPFQSSSGTTYLVNVSLKQTFLLPDTDAFLEDCLNKTLMLSEMHKDEFFAFVKIKLPLGMFECFALNTTQYKWVQEYLGNLRNLIEEGEYINSWQKIASFNANLENIPISQRLFGQIGGLIDIKALRKQTWEKNNNG